MTVRLDDRHLALALGIFLLAAVWGVRSAIRDINASNNLELSEPSEDAVNQRPEHMIDVSTLRTLADSPNHNIAHSAISLIVARFASLPHAHEILAKDCYAQDQQLRSQARTALNFLKDYPFPAGLAAGQQIPLSNADSLVRSPGPVPQSTEEWEGYFAARPELGLPEPLVGVAHAVHPDLPMSAGPHRREDYEHEDSFTRRPGESDTAFTGWTSIPRPRPSRQNEVEADRRRRRREAMVLHEGEGGVDEDDIFRPHRPFDS